MSDPIALDHVPDQPADRSALIMCQRCGRDIPAESTTCPVCGAPAGAAFQIAAPSENAQSRLGLVKFVGGLLLGLAVALLLAYLGVRK